MKLSYCTTCYNRLWQLEKTLPHNIQYLKCGEIELVIVAYNDNSVLPFLQANYEDYLNDNRIRVIEHNEDKIFSDFLNHLCDGEQRIEAESLSRRGRPYFYAF
mgnify:CR=1 FL=1